MAFHVDLYRRIIGEGPPLIILHGLFGMSDNWNFIGKQLSDKYSVHLVDLRNHGRSPHTDEFSYTSMADDIKRYIEKHNVDHPFIMGHSMGGKVGLRLASLYPRTIDGIIVVDIGLKEYAPSHLEYLKAMEALDLTEAVSRKALNVALANDIEDPIIRQFIMKNLRRNEKGRFEWRLNVNSIALNYGEVLKAILFDRPFDKPALFIRGSNSNHILDMDWSPIRSHFKEPHLVTIKDAGHWVHADQPEAFLSQVQEWLYDHAPR